MEIINGKLYKNRTWKYLYPCLKVYGNEFLDKLNSFVKLSVGVKDMNYENVDPCIFILVNVDIDGFRTVGDYREKFGNFLDWVKEKPYYEADYVFTDGKYKRHMLVIKIPEKFKEAYYSFADGEYSSMYSKFELANYFKDVSLPNNTVIQRERNEELKKIRAVLKRDKDYLEEFVNSVNKEFGTNVDKEHFLDAELDYPPNKNEEMFNYKED